MASGTCRNVHQNNSSTPWKHCLWLTALSKWISISISQCCVPWATGIWLRPLAICFTPPQTSLHIFDLAFIINVFCSVYCKCNGVIIFTSVHIQCILEGAMFEGMTAEHISQWLSPCLYVHVTGRLLLVCTAQVFALHDWAFDYLRFVSKWRAVNYTLNVSSMCAV